MRVMSMMMQRWKSKPKVEFQHGGRLFKKPEVVISQQGTVDWEMSPIFGMQVDLDLPN